MNAAHTELNARSVHRRHVHVTFSTFSTFTTTKNYFDAKLAAICVSYYARIAYIVPSTY